jgi:hypothetical protein
MAGGLALMDDIEVYRAANMLVKQHGSEALSKAAERAAELAVAGDQQGALVFKRIVEAIREMQRVQRDERERLN